MTVNLQSLGLDQLSREERLKLAGELWDSVVTTETPGNLLTETQRLELKRRVAEAETHPDDYVDWRDALANTLKRLSK